MRVSERSGLVVMAFMVCLWVIWDTWATFFLWLTQWSTISSPTIIYDFNNLYGEGQWWLSGAYLNPQTHAFVYPFAYPPSSLPLFGFFAQFEFGLAAQLWIGMGLTIFVVALFSAAYTLKPDRKYLFVSIAALLFFTSDAVRFELQLGQINLLLVSLTILSLVAHRSKHGRVSATLLAMGTLLKGPPVLFLLYFVVFHRDLRYLAHFIESTVALLGLSLLVVPIQLYWIWITNIFPTLFVSTPFPQSESVIAPISLFGLSYITPGIFVVGVCVFAAFAYRVYPNSLTKLGGPSTVAAEAMFLMNSLVILLLGTRSWPQDFVWAILPTALFLSALLVENVRTSYFVVVGMAAFLFNLDTYPVFLYYLSQDAHLERYIGYNQMVPMGFIGSLLMAVPLILFFLRPETVLQHRTQHLLASRFTRK